MSRERLKESYAQFVAELKHEKFAPCTWQRGVHKPAECCVCWTKISDAPSAERDAYVDESGHKWICKDCYNKYVKK